jgi:hypothetical protein
MNTSVFVHTASSPAPAATPAATMMLDTGSTNFATIIVLAFIFGSMVLPCLSCLIPLGRFHKEHVDVKRMVRGTAFAMFALCLNVVLMGLLIGNSQVLIFNIQLNKYERQSVNYAPGVVLLILTILNAGAIAFFLLKQHRIIGFGVICLLLVQLALSIISYFLYDAVYDSLYHPNAATSNPPTSWPNLEVTIFAWKSFTSVCCRCTQLDR